MIERDERRRERYLNARSYFTVSNTVIGEHMATIAAQHSAAIYARAQQAAQANLALLDRLFDEHPATFG